MASSLGGMARVCASCGKAEPEGVWFPKCARCVEFKLPSTLYCSPACQANHWPQHKVFHKQQKEEARNVLEGGFMEDDAALAMEGARLAEASGNEVDHLNAEGVRLMGKCSEVSSVRARALLKST